MLLSTCEHMILGQLRMGARQTNYVPLAHTNLLRLIGQLFIMLFTLRSQLFSHFICMKIDTNGLLVVRPIMLSSKGFILARVKPAFVDNDVFKVLRQSKVQV